MVHHARRRRASGLIRTGLLATCMVSAAFGPDPGAQEDASRPGITLARLKYGGGGDWYSNPTSLPNLSRALEERTSIRIAATSEARVAPLEEELFDHPLVYLNGHGQIKLTEAEAARLRQYLLQGGFLWADDNYGMDESFRQAIRQVFPDRELVEVPFDHAIYHAFYAFDNGPPKIHEHDGKPPQGFGIFDRGRLVCFYTYEADIGDGLEDPDVHDDPPEKREAALRMAINIVAYAVLGEESSRPVGRTGGARQGSSGLTPDGGRNASAQPERRAHAHERHPPKGGIDDATG